LREVLGAAELLANDWNVSSDVYSVTSFSELAREAAEIQRWNRLHPKEARRVSHIEQQLQPSRVTIAATDYVRSYPQLIAPYFESCYITLGTDGFGRSDTRPALRRFFEVDRHSIVIATLDGLARNEYAFKERIVDAIERYVVDTRTAPPWTL
jgi:pyruvate dehydrogenase E1 component